ncbi:MAG: lysostaphin resistance A-like protein [Candidatus Hodarchaeota archaeon]
MTFVNEKTGEQHSLVKSIFLHVITGILITLFLLFITPFLLAIGLTPEFGMLFGFIFIGEPIQLGYMLYLGRKKNNKFSLKGVILNQAPLLKGNYFLPILLVIAVIFIISTITEPINVLLSNTTFSWLPYWLLNSDPLFYTNSILIIQVIFVFQLIVDGVINPIIEELYWRGFLLPRLSRYGIYSVIINGFLIAIQHFWQIFNFALLIPVSLILSYIVYRYKSVYLSMITHCLINTIGILIFYIAIFLNF